MIFEASKLDFSKDYFQRMYEEKVMHTVKAGELLAQGQYEGTVGDQFALDVCTTRCPCSSRVWGWCYIAACAGVSSVWGL